MKIIIDLGVTNKLVTIKLFAYKKNSIYSKCRCHKLLHRQSIKILKAFWCRCWKNLSRNLILKYNLSQREIKTINRFRQNHHNTWGTKDLIYSIKNTTGRKQLVQFLPVKWQKMKNNKNLRKIREGERRAHARFFTCSSGNQIRDYLQSKRLRDTY